MEEGYYNGVITGVRPVQNRFGKDGFEIEFKIGLFDSANKPLAEVEIYEEISASYGVGNFATMTRAQITIDTLRKIGYAHGQDLSQLTTLVNKTCRVRVVTKDKMGQPYATPRCYFSFNEVKPLEGDVNAALAKIMSSIGGGSAPAPAPAPAAGAFNFAQAQGTAPAPSFPSFPKP